MRLLVRKKDGWINFLHNSDELTNFISNYIPNTRIIIGDLATYTNPMKSKLLKFIEENPMVECYSSVDIKDNVLLSRFVRIEKEVIVLKKTHDFDTFKESPRSYMDVMQSLSALSPYSQLMAVKAPNAIVTVLNTIQWQ